MPPGPSQTFDAEAVRQIVREEIKTIPRKSAMESLLFLLFESGGVDGVIKPGDVTTVVLGVLGRSVLWAGVGACAQAMTGLLPSDIIIDGHVLLSHINTFPSFGWVVSSGVMHSCYLGIDRIARELRYDPREWTTTEETPEEETIKLELREGNKTRFLHLDGQQAERARLFADKYLKVRKMSDYPTAEKHYVGRGKIWNNGKQDRQAWSEFRQALIDNRLAFEDGNRWHLTESGRRAMIKLCNPPTPSQ